VKLKVPASRPLRIAMGVALIIGGFLGFLPILGFWMIPLGVMVLSIDFHPVRRFRRLFEVRWGRNKRTLKESQTELVLIAIAVTIVIRAIVAAVTPLSFDEAYYWLWSKNLAWGYFDHPPLIAFIIRGGTALFGDTSIGVRFIPLLLTIVGTVAVWRAGAALLKSKYHGALAALFFSLMPMIGIETLTATPDAPQIAASAVLLYALVMIAETARSEWWVAAGAAAGFALLSKYTALFLGAGIVAWLIIVPSGRRWFLSFWLYLGGALALLMFAPVLIWNAGHDWASLALQFGRVDAGGFTLRYLGEFLAAQIGLATPFIAVLAVAGLVSIIGSREAMRSPHALLVAIMAPAVVYFVWHSLHDRVQGNWPSFLYPALAIAAVAVTVSGDFQRRVLLRWSRRLALPFAVFFSALIYAQAVWGIVPVIREPVGRLLAVGIGRVAGDIEILREQNGASGVITTNYGLTGWLSFYLPTHPPVVQVNERYRWVDAPEPPAEIFAAPLLYVTEVRNDQAKELEKRFREVKPLAFIGRYRNGATYDQYRVYRVSQPTGDPLD